MQGIYQITNLKSGKLYIGQSLNVEKRIKDHQYELSRGIHINRYLQAAWNKYGEANFVFSVLEEVLCSDDLTRREKYWVDFYGGYESDVLYNLREPGPSGKMSSDSLKRLSESQKVLRKDSEYNQRLSRALKNSWTPERRKQWSDFKKGKPLSEKHKEKLREVAAKKSGVSRPTEVKRKISETLKGHEVSEATREKLRNAAKKQPRRSLTADEKLNLSIKAKEQWRKRKECQEVVR